MKKRLFAFVHSIYVHGELRNRRVNIISEISTQYLKVLTIESILYQEPKVREASARPIRYRRQ